MFQSIGDTSSRRGRGSSCEGRERGETILCFSVTTVILVNARNIMFSNTFSYYRFYTLQFPFFPAPLAVTFNPADKYYRCSVHRRHAPTQREMIVFDAEKV